VTTLEFMKNLIRHPGQTVDVLKEKSRLLFLVLIAINAPIFGFLYVAGHFSINLSVMIFWIFNIILGFIALLLPIGIYSLTYFSIAKLVLKENEVGKSIKVTTFYYFLAFTVVNLLLIPITIVLLLSYNYYLLIYIYDISHLILLFWIVALSVQGVQLLRKDSEFRTLMKVSISIFTAYIIGTLFYLRAAAILISYIIR
jgi:hypothetical protein